MLKVDRQLTNDRKHTAHTELQKKEIANDYNSEGEYYERETHHSNSNSSFFLVSFNVLRGKEIIADTSTPGPWRFLST